MKREEIQLRLSKFLSGEGDVRNLERIFAMLRFRSHGRVHFRDVADFAAHSEGRDQGATFEGARIQGTVLDYVLRRMMGDMIGKPEPSSKTEYSTYAHASLKWATEGRIRDELGIDRRQAEILLKRSLSKIKSFDGKNWEFYPGLTFEQHRMLKFFEKWQAVPVWTADTLTDDFTAVLLKEKLIDQSQIFSVTQAGPRLAQFAMEKMDKVHVKFGKWPVRLFVSGLSEKLSVCAGYAHPCNPYLTVAVPIFSSDNLTAEWSTPDMFQRFIAKQPPRNEPIELDEAWRFRPLA